MLSTTAGIYAVRKGIFIHWLVWLVLVSPLAAYGQAFSYDDMWWNPAESGWGINLVQQGDVAFVTWFVFGQDRQPTWFVSTMRATSGTTYAGDLYTGTGRAYYAPSFGIDPAPPVGMATITFSDAQHASLRYTVKGTRIAKQIERFTFSPIDLRKL